MKKNKEKTLSKFWRFLVIIYFFVTIPILFSVCIWLFELSWTYLKYYRKYNDLDCFHYCTISDNYCKRICHIAWLEDWLENPDLSNKYVSKNLEDTRKIISKFQSKVSEKETYVKLNDYKEYYYNWDNDNIEKFAKDYWYWKWQYNYILGILYICLALLVYIILTDVLRWSVYYIDIWEFKLYIFSKIKSLFKMRDTKL